MLNTIFMMLLIASAQGLILTIILALTKPITEKLFPRSWHCYVWLAVLLVMMVPIRITLPEKDRIIINESESTAVLNTEHTYESSDIGDIKTPVENTKETVLVDAGRKEEKAPIADLSILSYVWLGGVAFMIMLKLGLYTSFILKVKKRSFIIQCPEIEGYTNRKITVRKSNGISSPMMYGLFKPVLVMPDADLDEEQLGFVLEHEIMHLKRFDVAYKWICSVVSCIHWFNPAVYYIAKRINEECEIACDCDVTNNMSREEKLGYINTIITLLSSSGEKEILFTTSMANNKELLKKRFIIIKENKRMGKGVVCISVACAIFMSLTVIFAGGVFAGEYLPWEYKITVRCEGEKTELQNKPFFENGTLYMPLEESLETLGVMNNEKSYVEYKDGGVWICVATDSGIVTYKDESQTISREVYYFIKEGEKSVYISHGEMNENIKVALVQNNAPVMRNSVFYVPFEMLDYMVDGGLGSMSLFDMTCIVKGRMPEMYMFSIRDFIWPCPDNEIISRAYSPAAGHDGIDIKASEGDSVVSAFDGKVREHGFDSVRGNFVVITDENGINASYHHLKEINVFAGETINCGDKIGTVGTTGMSTGAHLHFEVTSGKEHTDPSVLFPFLEHTMKDPLDTTSKFFAAFEEASFEKMKAYCTKECIDTFFEDEAVFGIKRAVLKNIDNDKLKTEYMKSSDDFNIFVDADIVPSEVSVFDGGGEVSFYVCLVRQEDGRYMIDSFSSGVPKKYPQIRESVVFNYEAVEMRIRDKKMVENKTVELDNEYTLIKYDFDTDFVGEVVVVPDSSGTIKFYFDTKFPQATADIRIVNESGFEETGAIIPTNPDKDYKLDGLKVGEKYKVVVRGYYPGNYDIEGSVMIY